jgi:ATP-dependent DNA helicase RecG
LGHFPTRHDDYSRAVSVVFLQEGEQTVRGRLKSASSRPMARDRRRNVITAFLEDDTGVMKAMWFNQPYLLDQLHQGNEYVLSGKVRRDRGGGLVMMSPAFEAGGAGGIHTGRLVPIYRETAKVSSKWLRRKVAQAMPAAQLMRDLVPETVAARQRLMPLPSAIDQAHFPESQEQAAEARRRIAFNQLLTVQVSVLTNRAEREKLVAPAIPYDVERAVAIRDALPFELTNAQRKAAHGIFIDMAEPRPMARLLQGDVGSGKTAVAAMAAAMVARAGHQTLLMAPTEILAQQHARTLKPYLDPLDMRMELLVGSTTAKARATILDDLAGGRLDVVVGTQALIEETVRPASLGLVISDEQHRFGIAQRQALGQRGTHPHVLSMTATPIPRTLQLTLMGDLSVSVLDEMPPGRIPVETRLVAPGSRDAAYDFIRKQVAVGRQVFVICPLVEASEAIQARSATGEYERLSTDVFPELRLALLHGRMKPADKDATMEAFRAGSFDILVSTSVVEVGVDVPNATVMMIEGAERFGLAQLHQFRGRVGRGGERAYCLLFSDSDGQEENRRLQAMVEHQSGFDLAEVDLDIRGPGDVLAATGAQHGGAGFSGLMVAGLLDARLIAAARDEAERLIAEGLDRYPELARAAVELDLAGTIS